MLSNKVDFAIIIGVTNANPNGDPLDGNRPRVNYEGYGEISDVSLKRKIRNRLLDNGEAILVQSHDYRLDEYNSIKERFDEHPAIKKVAKDRNKMKKAACETWYDVRAFGQVLAFKGKKNDSGDESGVSVGIRGPVTIQHAFSIEPVNIVSTQITKSVNLETQKDPDQKARDTMGMKHRVDRGVYVTYGSINRQLAELTGFSDDDADKLKTVLPKLFENDESSARPAGSMEVIKVIWWTHDSRVLPSAVVHRSLDVKPDGSYELGKIEGVRVEELDGC